MIIIMKPKASEEEIRKIKEIIEGKGLEVNLSKGDTYYIYRCCRRYFYNRSKEDAST